MIVAHRGASADAPENTLPAFELAWREGADAIEGDFRQTKDGHIVCIHDENTGKRTGKKLKVEKATLKELRALDAGSGHSDNFRNTPIPTITEVFATIPEQKKIYIEIKCSDSVVPQLPEEIKKAGLKDDQVVVISFDKRVIKRLKSLAPQYKAMLIVSFKRSLTGKIKPSLSTVLKTLKDINADGLSSGIKLIREEFVKKVIAQGYDYNAWTVDDPETAEILREWGVKSITTNRPGFLKKNLPSAR